MAAIQHPVFGALDLDSSGGISWEGQRTLSNHDVEVELTVMGGPLADVQELVEEAAPFVAELAAFDTKARECLRIDHDEAPDSAVVLYMDHHLEELSPELLLSMFGKKPAAVDRDSFLAALRLARVGLYPDDTDRCAVFDYTIDAKATQYLLVVTFDSEGEVIAIDMES